MPRIPFQKPKKVEWEELSERYGRLVAEPFEKGYALTVGNSLRRTLLSIVPGAAVSWVKIDGVRNAETRIPGVTESTVDVLLNLKKLAIQVPSGEPRVLRLDVQGPKAVTGRRSARDRRRDHQSRVAAVHHRGARGRCRMELGVGVGRGYEAADRKSVPAPAGALALDAAYSPITRVSYNVEMSRLGKITDYEKLVVEVWTNGAVSPDDALTRSATYLKEHFTPLRAGTREEDDDAAAASGEEFLRDALGKLDRGAAAARAGHQRPQEQRHPPGGRPRPEDGGRAGAGEEPGREVHRRDQDGPRRPRAVASGCASIRTSSARSGRGGVR